MIVHEPGQPWLSRPISPSTRLLHLVRMLRINFQPHLVSDIDIEMPYTALSRLDMRPWRSIDLHVSDRLPTVSASEAFRDLSDDDHPLSNAYTEIDVLDDALGGGFECGKVTELWGPPGAGKTAIAYAFAKSISHGFY